MTISGESKAKEMNNDKSGSKHLEKIDFTLLEEDDDFEEFSTDGILCITYI